MADRVIAERDVIAVGNDGLFSLADGERNEVVGFAFQRVRDFSGHGGDHALEIEGVDRDLSRHGIADSVGCLRDRREPDYFGGTARDGRGRLRHSALFSTHEVWGLMRRDGERAEE